MDISDKTQTYILCKYRPRAWEIVKETAVPAMNNKTGKPNKNKGDFVRTSLCFPGDIDTLAASLLSRVVSGADITLNISDEASLRAALVELNAELYRRIEAAKVEIVTAINNNTGKIEDNVSVE